MTRLHVAADPEVEGPEPYKTSLQVLREHSTIVQPSEISNADEVRLYEQRVTVMDGKHNVSHSITGFLRESADGCPEEGQ